ncbi:Histidine kinase [Dyadobacter soli]|uniref:Histidine kinase n=1 Tax=Dyadobacter soli TaxID=659014 RepID=A0A1G7SJY0_9BACT|nr:histidine kinase [Dyadobacter soli]SDG23298.1 Histidine kinase [Dyadobacter soli]
MKKRKYALMLFFLLVAITHLNAQTLVLDPAGSRFLIDEKTREPRLDLIVHSFTTHEKRDIPRYAVMDTVTKPTVSNVGPSVYHVTAGRMAERMTLVIRNPASLPADYVLKVDGEPVRTREDIPDIAYYQLNGEQCNAAALLPFRSDSTTVSLFDSNARLISQLLISWIYPKPELFYVDVRHHYAADIRDTSGLRQFMHFFNRAPNTYSKPNAVPDSLSIAEAEPVFGFKRAYYDGKVRPSRISYRIGKKGQWIGTTSEITPHFLLEHVNGNWSWLVDGPYEIQYSYTANERNYGSYAFAIDHTWINSFAYNARTLLWLVGMVLMTKLWLTTILAGVIMYFYFRKRLRKARDQARKTNLELQSIQSQLNPHFVFNAMGSLQGLINKSEIDRANTYLTGFSRLLRNTLQNSGREMVPLDVEMTNIENYIQLEQLRFGFRYAIATDETVRQTQLEVPSLLIQPVVENAVKHGISGLGAAGMLEVTFKTEHEDLLISIRDNGHGFDTDRQTQGKGLALTHERIKLLNKQKYRIAMEVASGNEGTIVILTFKKWL